MAPGTLVIRLSWTTIVSTYRPLDMFGNPSRPLGRPRQAPGKGLERGVRP